MVIEFTALSTAQVVDLVQTIRESGISLSPVEYHEVIDELLVRLDTILKNDPDHGPTILRKR